MKGKKKFLLILILLFGFKKTRIEEKNLYGEFIAKLSHNIFLTSEGYLLKVNNEKILDSLNKKYLPYILTNELKPDSIKRNSLFYSSSELLKEIKRKRRDLYLDIEIIEPETLKIKMKKGKIIYFGLGRFEKKIEALSRLIDKKDTIELELLSFLEGGN